MHRYALSAIFITLLILFLCSCPLPTGPVNEDTGDTTPAGPVIVTIGDSITMGIQDAGLKYDFQVNCYPNLIAQQMEVAGAFRQPYLLENSPGIAVPPYKEPLKLVNGEIDAVLWEYQSTDQELLDYVVAQLPTSTTLSAARFHNLGVNGARLFDIRYTTNAETSQGGNNVFFDLVLLNSVSETNRTVLTQAQAMEPDYIILWIGNNDILHVVLDGAGVDGAHFTDPDRDPTDETEFQTEYNGLLEDLVAITPNVIVAKLPAYLPFVYALDGIFQEGPNLIGDFPDGALCAFDPATFEPAAFDSGAGELYLPLIVEDTNPSHLLLSGVIAYMDLEDADPPGQINAVGLPTVSDLTDPEGNYKLDAGDDADLIASILAFYDLIGAVPTGMALPGTTTLTDDEIDSAGDYIDAYNTAIQTAADTHSAVVVDMAAAWWAAGDFGGYSGLHAVQEPGTSTFSLDGVHPNNLGHALCANAFISAMNTAFELDTPLLAVGDYAGQYTGMSITSASIGTLLGLREQ